MAEETKDEKKVEEKKSEPKEEKPEVEEKKEEPKKEVKAEEPKEPAQSPAGIEAGEEVEVPKKFKKLVEEIEKMTVLDLAELVKILEKKFGVSAAAPVAVAAAAGAGEAAGAEEEKDSFNVELTETGGNKIGVIKVLREITQQGLKECKDMSEGAPVVLKEGVKKEEAEEMKKKLEEAGAKVTLK